MAEIVAMPKLAKSMKRGKITEWKVKDGELVEKGQVILIVETEKVALECEAPASGYLHIIGELDKIYSVGDTIALVASNEVELNELQVSQPSPEGEQNRFAGTASGRNIHNPSKAPPPEGRVKTSPAAKKLARTHGLDISKITGTGPGGRIKKEDVINYMESDDLPIPEAESIETSDGEVIDGKRIKAVIPFRVCANLLPII